MRAELQPAVEHMLAHLLSEHGVSIIALDVVHGRRTIRALIRVAARIARGLGCDASTFVRLSAACFAEESAITQRVQA